MAQNIKRNVVVVSLAMLVFAAGTADAGRGGGWGPPVQEISCDQVLDEAFEDSPVSDLDRETLDNILFLREEEKMARDLYLEMSLLYDLSIFSNIARSEQGHMDLVAKLLDRYDLEDPAADRPIGEFFNPWIQETYNDLHALGSQGLIDALWMGAIVEDVDIYHLDHMIEHCLDHEFYDVSLIVQNMNAGSRNHMRSFFDALQKRDVTYEAVDEEGRISQERLDEIVESERETAVVLDEFGDELAECGLAGGSRR